jgi:hypothetical protein
VFIRREDYRGKLFDGKWIEPEVDHQEFDKSGACMKDQAVLLG